MRTALTADMNDMHLAMFKLLSEMVGLSLGVGVTFGSLLAALTVILR